MAEVTDKEASEFVEAVNSHSGPSAQKILDEVGPCGWDSLMKKASKTTTDARGYSSPALADVILEAEPSKGTERSVELWAGIRGTAVRMAHSKGDAAACDTKPVKPQ